MRKQLLIIFLVIFSLTVKAVEPYKDTSLSVDERVNDLISRMTLTEKIAQLGHKSAAIGRLGVKSYNYWNEGIHGVARAGRATSFPVSIALSSTWNPELIYQIASATSDEARIKNITDGKGLTYWSPTINMARDPRWGRSEENYGEDVHLASEIALSFIKGMQGSHPKYMKTVATAKHFACNNVEKNRNGISSDIDERSLREYYLPVFKDCVTKGGVYSIMSAYNAVNGVPCPANRTLLTNILRNEWNFEGYVVSDCDAVENVFSPHAYVASVSEATAISLRNGNDLNCGTTFPNNALSALNQGLMKEADIDEALKRVFKARFLLGEFDPASAVPYTSIPDSILDCKAHKNLALKAAREAIVLLKNDNSTLPLDKNTIDKIAVIGPNANAVQLGGYSGTPSIHVSALQGIANKLGIDISTGIIEAEHYSSQNGIEAEACEEGGSNIGYINNNDYAAYDSIDFGTVKEKLDIRVASETTGGYIEIFIDKLNGKSIGKFEVPGTGGWQNWKTVSFDIENTNGVHNVYLKFTGGSGYLFNLNWFRFYNEDDENPTNGDGRIAYAQGTTITGSINQSEIDKAVNMAKASDVAIVVCGTDLSVADESNDRSAIGLPGVQEKLIQEVYKVNQKTIVVLITGVPLSVNWAQENAPAIICAWYNGQAQGTAIADVLFGDYNPAGRLSTTWYKSTNDLPNMHEYDIKNNRTYMYYNDTPLYPFGHGLSYTNFEYDNLKLSSENLLKNDSLTISANITNTGEISGDEVVQLYIHTNSLSEIRPNKQLKGFKRINLAKGETKTVSFTLKHEDLQFYDPATRTFIVEEGLVDVYIGSSSEDIWLTGQLSADAATISSTYRHDPFIRFEAEHFESNSKNCKISPCLTDELCVEVTGNESYIAIKNFDFNKPAKQFNANIASINQNTKIEIVLDDLNGEVAGTLHINSTGNIDSFKVKSCKTDDITGIRDIYLVLKGTSLSQCKINWFSFQETITTGTNKSKYEQSGYGCNLYPNPAKSLFTIEYKIPDRTDIEIEICDTKGAIIKSYQYKQKKEGTYLMNIDPESEQLSPGIFFVRFRADNYLKSIPLSII
ncbi:MAG: glycoside hydrolase family 3 C-terminal domain-containing protein [Prolixibacteraceae bacterium]|jgi:beta-glucosidase|nr:glycoside hydrolase family 3 C-terminal domain-containing protein [Prolixibacteraceae bacterium]